MNLVIPVSETLKFEYDVYAHHTQNLISSHLDFTDGTVGLPPGPVIPQPRVLIDIPELEGDINITNIQDHHTGRDSPRQLEVYRKLLEALLREGVPEDLAKPLAKTYSEEKTISGNIETMVIWIARGLANILARDNITGAKIPVGILGAGPGGLYTALMLEDLRVPYHIIEGRDRVGGRLYTHEFSNKTGYPYNYYDVGAMRFPNINAMRRLFHLFDYPPLNTGGKMDLSSRVKPYIFKEPNGNAFLSYNGITVKQGDRQTTTFKANDVIQDVSPNVAAQYITTGTDAIVNDVIGPYAKPLLDDLKNGGNEGWKKLMEVDKHSTRSFMSLQYIPSNNLQLPKTPLPTDVINWCETFDKSTGWYDRAFSETVLEAVAFGWNQDRNAKPTDWRCVDGGAYQIARVMADYILSKKPNSIDYNARVIRIAKSQANSVEVTTAQNPLKPYQFSHVVSTIPFPVLRVTDLSDAKLTPMQSNALRDLNYGPSIKIGMQFKTAWWFDGKDKSGKQLKIVGGQTYTDSPLRTVVYPSFGKPQSGGTTTLIASYCWTEDATRTGALITTPEEKEVLKGIVIGELARIHNMDEDFIRKQLLGYHAWNWVADSHTMGAFAFFGPGKFKNPYISLTSPAADGLLHFAGEALSPRHAWVEGALDSAWRAVFGLIMGPGFRDLPYLVNLVLRVKFGLHWGFNPEWTRRVTHPAQWEREEKENVRLEDTLLLKHLYLSEVLRPGLEVVKE